MRSSPDTLRAAERWQSRHETYAGDWLAMNEASSTLPFRALLADLVMDTRPTSVFEVGCNVGVNLALLRERSTELVLGGCDVNALALARARVLVRKLAAWDGSLLAVLPKQSSASWDVVLSCYTLAYVSPADLPDVLCEVRRVARRALILAEPMGEPTRLNEVPEWRHDYLDVLQQLGMPTGWMTYAALPGKDHLNRALVVALPFGRAR